MGRTDVTILENGDLENGDFLLYSFLVNKNRGLGIFVGGTTPDPESGPKCCHQIACCGCKTGPDGRTGGGGGGVGRTDARILENGGLENGDSLLYAFLVSKNRGLEIFVGNSQST